MLLFIEHLLYVHIWTYMNTPHSAYYFLILGLDYTLEEIC